ncbi:PAS domain S-box protein [Leptospira ryugenii]|uniref:histidine kinase n=1 Tax=Leptospira ryugenii TaxID=1917863 RepID=A0A2P2E3J1_9LEPT|nr:PAS domain-containing sensor histidine kinase [Leptospira ryugenii]GBF51437.1 PAS domain S-box protein [Leptospira ryugenii]
MKGISYLPTEIWSKIFQLSPVGITITSLVTGKYVDVNDRFLEWLKLDREQVIGKSSLELNVYADNRSREQLFELINRDGHIDNFEININPRYSDRSILINARVIEDGKYLLSIGQDVTELKEKEKNNLLLQHELQVKNQLFENMFRLNPAAVSLSDASTGLYIDINQAYCDLIGFSREEIIGHTSHELNIWITQFDRASLMKIVEEKGWSTGLEASIRTKNGEIRHVLSGNTLFHYQGSLKLLAILIDVTDSKNNKSDLENAVFLRTKELEKTLENLKLAQEQLIQSEKMAVLGQLVAGVAHEINNPMGAIAALSQDLQHRKSEFSNHLLKLITVLNVYPPNRQQQMISIISDLFLAKFEHYDFLLARKLRKDLAIAFSNSQFTDPFHWADEVVDLGLASVISQRLMQLDGSIDSELLKIVFSELHGLRSLDLIQEAVERTSRILYSLRNYTFLNHSKEKVKTNVLDTIQTVLTLYQTKIKMGVECTVIAEVEPIVDAYPDELIQVWTNLIYNSLQAMDFKGKLTILVESGAQETSVTIIDNGPGVPKELREKIFEPFFTTKSHGEGSGLGLGIVKRCIEENLNGKISLDSKPGETKFKVILPNYDNNST